MTYFELFQLWYLHIDHWRQHYLRWGLNYSLQIFCAVLFDQELHLTFVQSFFLWIRHVDSRCYSPEKSSIIFINISWVIENNMRISYFIYNNKTRRNISKAETWIDLVIDYRDGAKRYDPFFTKPISHKPLWMSRQLMHH